MIDKVVIQQINKFKVTINGKTYDNFEKVDEWNGMLHFTGPKGMIIVHKPENMFATFATIFGGSDQEVQEEFDLAKISSDLLKDSRNVEGEK